MLSKIELAFENCDSIIFPVHFVKKIFVDGVKTRYTKYDMSELTVTKHCEEVHMILHNNANQKKFINPLFNDTETTPFSRIKANDITHIIFHYDSEFTEEIAVKYNGTEINDWQTTKENKYGELVIHIVEKGNV